MSTQGARPLVTPRRRSVQASTARQQRVAEKIAKPGTAILRMPRTRKTRISVCPRPRESEIRFTGSGYHDGPAANKPAGAHAKELSILLTDPLVRAGRAWQG